METDTHLWRNGGSGRSESLACLPSVASTRMAALQLLHDRREDRDRVPWGHTNRPAPPRELLEARVRQGPQRGCPAGPSAGMAAGPAGRLSPGARGGYGEGPGASPRRPLSHRGRHTPAAGGRACEGGAAPAGQGRAGQGSASPRRASPPGARAPLARRPPPPRAPLTAALTAAPRRHLTLPPPPAGPARALPPPEVSERPPAAQERPRRRFPRGKDHTSAPSLRARPAAGGAGAAAAPPAQSGGERRGGERGPGGGGTASPAPRPGRSFPWRRGGGRGIPGLAEARGAGGSPRGGGRLAWRRVTRGLRRGGAPGCAGEPRASLGLGAGWVASGGAEPGGHGLRQPVGRLRGGLGGAGGVCRNAWLFRFLKTPRFWFRSCPSLRFSPRSPLSLRQGPSRLGAPVF